MMFYLLSLSVAISFIYLVILFLTNCMLYYLLSGVFVVSPADPSQRSHMSAVQSQKPVTQSKEAEAETGRLNTVCTMLPSGFESFQSVVVQSSVAAVAYMLNVRVFMCSMLLNWCKLRQANLSVVVVVVWSHRSLGISKCLPSRRYDVGLQVFSRWTFTNVAKCFLRVEAL